MLTFIHPLSIALVAGLLSLPVLIHLINMMRHRRVQWAAMEFLLVSQKKNSTWIRIKELLLLLMRMLAVAAVLLILAQPLLSNQMSRLFGGVKKHHVVLLDDSFSMSDRWADTNAFDEAKKVIGRLGEQAANQPVSQTFTLLRYSRAGRGQSGTQPDLREQTVDAAFGQKLQELLRPMQPSELSLGPDQVLQSLDSLLGQGLGEERMVYLVSDFRTRDWDQVEDLAKRFTRLSQDKVQLHLIDCVDAMRPNLAITALAPQRGTRAAGVQLTMEVTVRNFGAQPVSGVTVLLREDDNPRPALVIDRIGAGQSETKQYQAFFSTAGEHLLSADLQSDAVAADNARYSLVDLPVNVPVLIIDPDADARDGAFLASALAPGGSVKTGVDPQIEQPSYLNTHPLDKFQAIYLTNLDRLDQTGVDALESYVRAGGGVAFYVGDKTLTKFFNEQLYRGGKGIFPLPLIAETQLLVDRLDKGADLEVADHPIFKIFAGERNGFLSEVTIDRYFGAPQTWTPPADSNVSVLAKLRNGAPFALERKFGEGRVVAILTTAAPVWNNWARNPSFVVATLELQSYLASPATAKDILLVGSPIEVPLDLGKYQPRVRLLPPGLGEAGALFSDAATPAAGGPARASFYDTNRSGFYKVQLTTTENKTESRQYALNVVPQEGDLNIMDGPQLAERLPKETYTFHRARDFRHTARELAGSNLTDWILYLLVLLLVGEQLLAYSASYHPATETVR
jgi:hypothetical protein